MQRMKPAGAAPTVALKDPRRRTAVAHHRGVPARPLRHRAAPNPTDIGEVRAWVEARRGPTVIDLFAGAGGLSLGLHQAGFEVLVGADSDAWAMETHGANLPGLTWCGDLSDPTDFLQTLDVWGISTVDLVAGGVPCQPFSRAGRPRIQNLVETGERAVHDARADLWESFIAVVARLKPQAVLVENVPDLPRWNDGEVLIGFYESLRALGYVVDGRVLDGFRHGVPQHRQRLILIGLSEGRRPIWPMPADAFVSLHDAIGDLPIIPRAQRSEELPYDAARMTSRFQREMRDELVGDEASCVWDHICRDVRPDDMEAFSLMSQGQTYIDLPQRLRRYRSDVFTDKYKRLVWVELCRSITAHIAKDGYWYIHPDQHRTLSVREAARVQTFPDHFRFAGTQTHRFRQVGNAVPVKLARAVGCTIRSALESPGDFVHRSDEFRDALVSWYASIDGETPWRTVADPWSVLIGELALQRSPRRFANATYPVLRALARTPANLAEDPGRSEEALRGVGLKSSAGLLVAVATELVDRHGGSVPEDDMALRSIGGVGEYVCQAVLCFGFGRRAVLVDRVTSRISSRVHGRGPSQRFQLRLDLHSLAGANGPDPAFNAALLELGERYCGLEPRCRGCPVRSVCATGSGRAEGKLPDVPDTDDIGVAPGRSSSAVQSEQEGVLA